MTLKCRNVSRSRMLLFRRLRKLGYCCREGVRWWCGFGRLCKLQNIYQVGAKFNYFDSFIAEFYDCQRSSIFRGGAALLLVGCRSGTFGS